MSLLDFPNNPAPNEVYTFGGRSWIWNNSTSTWNQTGLSGTPGTSGYSGYSGSGVSGHSGYSGYSSAIQGPSGYSGYSGPAPTIYDMAIFIAGTPNANEICLRNVAVRAFSIPSSLSGSEGNAITAPSSSTDFTVWKNSVTSIGTITFAASSNTSTFSGSGSTFAVGDIISIVAPNTLNSISDISITLKGVLL